MFGSVSNWTCTGQRPWSSRKHKRKSPMHRTDSRRKSSSGLTRSDWPIMICSRSNLMRPGRSTCSSSSKVGSTKTSSGSISWTSRLIGRRRYGTMRVRPGASRTWSWFRRRERRKSCWPTWGSSCGTSTLSTKRPSDTKTLGENPRISMLTSFQKSWRTSCRPKRSLC